MQGLDISNKTYDYVYREIKGAELKKAETYKDVFISDTLDNKEVLFLVYTNDENIQSQKEYTILGIGSKSNFWGLVKHVKFIYIVELFDNEVYSQNSGSGCVKGRIKASVKYKLNFNYNDIEKKGNTFINLIQKIGYKIDNVSLEMYALASFNSNLLSNIIRYKGSQYADYDAQIEYFKRNVIKQIKINNIYGEQLHKGIKELYTFSELNMFIKENKEKLLDQSDLLYNRNDNIKNCYPVNMVNTNVSLNLYDGYRFNSSLPYYFQYRNYRQSTEVLAEKFFSEIFLNEDIKRENELKKMKHYFGGKPLEELGAVNALEYGLYFPLLMSFRQSIELAFKLIFVNEDLKRQTFLNKNELNKYVKKINTHDLIPLLKLIKEYLEQEVYEFLHKLASFVFYNEGMDASFSRYLVDKNLDFDELKQITIYYIDLYNYINEFYRIMDYVFEQFDFGFNIDDVFVK